MILNHLIRSKRIIPNECEAVARASLEYAVDHFEEAAGREQRAVERRAVQIDRVAEECAVDELRVAQR